ncbi:hypothetical protein [Luteimonas deserti]|uniref:hypothetical protein n=1 Tax=Luteimonas deserti TaxID=2752306 RepID=UPI0015D82AC4|nr:hypothetical protein [Luteimonas deserti]
MVEPFPLDQAGSSVSVTFELPDARDNGILRPVFVGFQAVDRKGRGPDEEMLAAQTVRDYLRNEAIPVRVRLWRIEGTEWRPVVLSDGHWDMKDKRASWGLHPDDVFRHHFSASTDNGPLIASGHYDFGKVYYVHAFARIVPPTPGRYHLEVENLDAHSVLLAQKEYLSVLRYELLVSHYHHRGID